MINNIMRILTMTIIGFGAIAISSAMLIGRYDIVFSVIIMYITTGVTHVVVVDRYLNSDEATDLEQRMMRLLPFNWRTLIVLVWPYIWLR